MRPRTSIVPRKGTDRWLYETLRHLQQGVDQSALGLQAIVRGEVPDGSGTPLPNPDLTGYFKLIGRADDQIGYGSIDAGGALTFGSTSHATKGFIYLGTSLAQFALDEVQSRYGFNKGVPTSTLHLVQSSAGTGSIITCASDIDATGTRWVARTGSGGSGSGSTIAAALSNDDGLTTYGSINTVSSGNNPQRCTLSATIVPGATYTVTAKISTLFVTPVYGGGNQNFFLVSLIDSAGNEWQSNEDISNNGAFTEVTAFGTFATVTRTVVCSGSPHSTGNTPSSIWLSGGAQISHGGGGDLYFICTYVTVAQAGSSIMRWDFAAGTQSGGIDIFGRLGINTGSTSPAGEIHVQGTSTALPVLVLQQPASPVVDAVQLLASTGKITAAVTSRGAWAGHTDLVMIDDEVVGYEDDTVFFY